MARKILLADDSVTAQNMGRKILADAGYEVITVNNGSAALKRIAEAKPDLIVLDVYMPGYSGLEVCQRLKDSNDTARIPILLTVGKLEPFKPEEARRVRAEAYIVKPFEASELLSALTKLEDKIVPRADSSKPGRFARAIAAVEEGRYDKTVAIDEDSGWKNRISFPKKKKEKPLAPEEGDDLAIYNPVNRDLKTLVEPPAQEQAQTPIQPAVQTSAPPEQAHVNLGALVAHGLPKDVTPEEIAALAAAAAQVQGVGKNTNTEPVSLAPTANVQQAPPEEAKPDFCSAHTDAVRGEEIKPEASSGKHAAAQVTETAELPAVASAETKTEEAPKSEAQERTIPPAASCEKISNEVVATFASEKLQRKEAIEPETNATEVSKPETSSAAIDAVPTIASFATGDSAASSADGATAQATPSAERESLTTATAVEAAPSRWAAVAVALAPAESSISLEEEMRRAEAAPIAAALPQATPVVIEAQAADEPVSPDKAQAAEMLPATREPEASATSMLSSPEPPAEEPPAVTSSATPVVKEFETVAAPDSELSNAVSEAAVESASPVVPIVMESAEVPAAGPGDENAREMQLEQSASASVIESAAKPAGSPTMEEPSISEQVTSIPSEVIASSADQEMPADTQPPEAARSTEVCAEQVPDSHISRQSVEAAPVAAVEGISGGLSEMVKKESEIAASTAAAWASWRRIRESDGKGAELGSSPGDEAAMAVAAGAEKAPEEASDDAEVSPEIASIVDTVLADLRPKIVEEISKKLGKKK